MEEQSKKIDDKDVVSFVTSCRDEADEAKRERSNRNKDNFDMFHLRHDFSHKKEGQSQEVLSKLKMAVVQITSFFQQALADLGEWWKAECRYNLDERTLVIRPEEITKLTNHMLENANYFSHVGNSVQSALMSSLAISKCYGVMVPKPKYVPRKKGRGKTFKRWLEKIEDYTWSLRFDVVRAENFYPDPTGKGLYIIEDMWVDYHEALKLAEGPDAIYDKSVLDQIPAGYSEESDEAFDRARETGQNTTTSGHRPKIKITEFWGTILDKDGRVVHENCVCAVANDTHLIRKPEPNPLWHQKHPYTYSPLMEVANSVWHTAAMDAPAMHNRALIELYNLMLDAGMKQVHAVSQLRKEALDNPAQVSDGIQPGQTLTVNSMLPVGGKVLEPLTAVTIPPDALSIFNLTGQEFNASALTNDLRQGVMPFRAVKATEVVEASQTITSVFQGMAKNYEARQSTKELELAWQTVAQNWDRISKEEFISLFGSERGEELSQLPPEEVFAATVNGMKFKVFGVSLTLSKNQDFRKYQTLLQTVFGIPVLTEKFMERYDPTKLLGEIMSALNLDKAKIELPIAVQKTMEAPQEGQPEAQPDMMSQIPQASSGSLGDMFGGPQFPQAQFPGSPAIPGGNV